MPITPASARPARSAAPDAVPPAAAPAPEAGTELAAQVVEVRGAWARVFVPAIDECRWVHLETGVVLEALDGAR